jgi:myo-inositol 2-dehydrogenase / D-chiro-inositol 1-dehydrogenase
MTGAIRVGIIGYGGIGRLHAGALMNVPGMKLIAVADARAALLEGLDPAIRRFSDYRDLLQLDIDAVIVCSPTSFHAPTCLDALCCGKHVLVEKPMATTVEQGRAMCDRAREVGRVLMVGMTHRFYPEMREAKHLVDDGAIGEVLMCNDTIIEPLGSQALPGWYMDKAMAGGGVAMSDGIHLIDRLRWFTGLEARRVMGSVGNKYFASPVEDTAHMFLWLDGDVTAHLTMAFMKATHPLVCSLQLVGTKGSMVVHTWQGYTLHGPLGTEHRVLYQNESHAYKVQVGLEAEISEFASAITENRSAVPGPEDSLKALEIVTAFYTAAETGAIISLN